MIGVIGIVILLFSATGYTNASGKSYSIASMLMPSQDFTMDGNIISMSNLIVNGMGGIFRVFSMICTGISFVMCLSAERTSGYVRYINYYAGTREYVLSKTLAGLISGGITGVVGFCLYATSIFISLKVQDSYSITEIDGSLLVKTVVVYGLGLFLYGVVTTSWIYLFAAWIKNKYLLICLPFFTYYLYLQLLFKVKLQFFDAGRIDELNNISIIDSTSLIYTFTTSTHKMIIVIHSMFVLASMAIFYYGMKRRKDLGE